MRSKKSYSTASIRELRVDQRSSLLQLTLAADGVEYDSFDWGLGGIRIHGIIADRKLDESLAVRVSGRRKGQYLSLDAMATIVRIDLTNRQTALRFDDLSAESLDVLEALITGRRISA